MKKCSVRNFKTILTLSVLFTLLMVFSSGQAYGASPITIDEVDYRDENIIVNNNDNSRIFFATENDAARNNWELMPADTDLTTTIDFSWVSPTAEQIIVIKGEDDVQSRVTLRERTRKLEVSISYDKMTSLDKAESIAVLLNVMSTAGTGDKPITFFDLEWKKGENGSWQETNVLTVAQLEKLQIKGADIYFRIKAVNDETTATNIPDGTKGRRISKEVRLKVSKKASPAVVGIDGEEFKADIKSGKEYRVTYDGKTTKWVKVTDKSIRNVLLSDMLNDEYDGFTPATKFPEMLIEVRNYATSRSAASKTTEIPLKLQRILLGEIISGETPEDLNTSDPNIYIAYNGTANIAVTIPSASSDNPYQYTIVKPGNDFNNEKAIWTNITRNTAVKILSSKLEEGSELYIRQKEIKYKAETKTSLEVDYELASTYKTHKIEYPSVPTILPQSFTFIKGVSEDISFDVKLNNIGKLPYETTIKSIKLGTREIKFTLTPELTGTLDPNQEYTIKVTINNDDLKDMPNSYSRALYVYFGNNYVNKTSIKLAIQSATPAAALSANASKGMANDTIVINVIPGPRTGNILVYTKSVSKVEGLNTEAVVTDGTLLVMNGEIPVQLGEYVTVYEINATSRKVARYKSIQIIDSYLN